MGLSSGGSMEQKLQGSFMLFDKDHNGELEKDEVITCFQTLLRSSMYKSYVESHGGKKPKSVDLSRAQMDEIANIVSELFDSLDSDKVCHRKQIPGKKKMGRKKKSKQEMTWMAHKHKQNGTIDMQEFVNGFKTHPELCQPMMQF